MTQRIEIEDVKEALLSLDDRELREAEAIYLVGSLARGVDFTQRSDLDIVVVVKEKTPQTDILWYRRMYRVLAKFRRDITVLVYSLKGIESISNWYVLRMAQEGVSLYDKANVAGLFKEVVETAKRAGLVEREVGNFKVWSNIHRKLGESLEIPIK